MSGYANTSNRQMYLSRVIYIYTIYTHTIYTYTFFFNTHIFAHSYLLCFVLSFQNQSFSVKKHSM
jgi:hypothetical protein